MPGTDSLGQNVPYPTLADTPNIESAMSALVGAVVPLLNMTFPDASTRSAYLPTPTTGMETYLVAEARKDRWNGTAWIAVSPSAWTTLSIATGYSAFAGSPSFRIVDGTVELRGQISKSDSTTFVSNGSTGYHIATLPMGFRPTYSPPFITAQELATNYYCRMVVNPAGEIWVYVPSGGSPHWVGLDGIRFSTT